MSVIHGVDLDGNKVAFKLDSTGTILEGISGIAYNRHLDSLNTTYARATNGASFSAIGGIRGCWITVIPAAAGTAGDLSKDAWVTFGAPTEAYATSVLADTGGQAVDVQQWQLILGQRCGPFYFTDFIDWIDISTDVAGKAIIEGVQ